MLQGRLFSYTDTHRHRLGPNYDQIPINCPYRARVENYLKDGPMNVTSNHGNQVVYEPNSLNGPVEDPAFKWKRFEVTGEAGRYPYHHPNDDFEQPRAFYRKVLSETGREHLVSNICETFGQARRDIQERQLKIFYKVDPDLAQRIAKTVGLPVEQAKL